jgi:hypothetical protein
MSYVYLLSLFCGLILSSCTTTLETSKAYVSEQGDVKLTLIFNDKTNFVHTASAKLSITRLSTRCDSNFLGEVLLSKDEPLILNLLSGHTYILTTTFLKTSPFFDSERQRSFRTSFFAERGYSYSFEQIEDSGSMGFNVYVIEKNGSKSLTKSTFNACN